MAAPRLRDMAHEKVVNMEWSLNGLLTFLGSLYKERRENYLRNFGISLQETNRQKKKKSSFQKHCVLNLKCRILSQEHDTIGNKLYINIYIKILGVTGCLENNRKLYYYELRKSFPGTKLRIA